MAQIPYSPVPTVAPSEAPTPGFRLNTPEGAFGGGEAGATSEFGQRLGATGNELFGRAMALKEVDNRTEADQLNVDVSKALGEQQATFKAYKGADAKANLQQHFTNMESARADIVGRASNPMVAKLANSESRGFMSREIFSASAHAGDEFSKYQLKTSMSVVQSLHDKVGSSAKDQGLWDDSLEQLRLQMQTQAGLEGLGSDVAEQKFSREQSKLALTRVTSLGLTDPVAAEKMKNDYIKTGVINGDDVYNADKRVKIELNTTGARNVASGLFNGDNPHFGDGVVSSERAKLAIAGNEADARGYQSTGPVTPHGRGLGKYQVVEEYLPDYLKKAGMPLMTAEEYLNNPKAQEDLFEKTFVADMNKYGSFNEAASRWLSGRSVADAIKAGATDVNGTDVPAYLKKANATLARNMTLTELQAAGNTIAAQQSSDPNYSQYVTAQIGTMHEQQKKAEQEDRRALNDTITGILYGVNNPTGHKPESLDEFMATPEGRDAWDRGSKIQKKVIIEGLHRNVGDPYSFTTETLKEYHRIKGMSESEDQNVLAEFMDIAISEQHFPDKEAKLLLAKQRALRKNSETSPQVSRAMDMIGYNILDAQGVNKKTDPDNYYIYRGQLAEKIERWHDANPKEKKPTIADYKQMNKELMEPIIRESIFGDKETPLWQMQPTEEEIQAIIKQYKSRGVDNLTEGEVLLAHVNNIKEAKRKRLVKRAQEKEQHSVNPDKQQIGMPTFSP